MPTLREVTSLSYRDALAALVGDAAADAVAKTFVPAALKSVPPADLANLPGVGPAKAKRIQAAIAVGYWVSTDGELPSIANPETAAEFFMPQMAHLEQEELWVMLLDTRNHVLDVVMVYRGSSNSAQVRVGELFKDAVRRNAAAIIVAHNHPSGDPNPSPDDVAVTHVIRKAGEMLDIEVLDHLVIGRGRFVSMKRRGLGF